MHISMKSDFGQLTSQSIAQRLSLEATEVSRQQICEVDNTNDNLFLQLLKRIITCMALIFLLIIHILVSFETTNNLLQATITSLDI